MSGSQGCGLPWARARRGLPGSVEGCPRPAETIPPWACLVPYQGSNLPGEGYSLVDGTVYLSPLPLAARLEISPFIFVLDGSKVGVVEGG